MLIGISLIGYKGGFKTKNMKTVDDYLIALEKKGNDKNDQLLTKLHAFLMNQKANGKGNMSVTNVEMLNLINKYL